MIDHPPLVFLSYDEPNALQNYEHLKRIVSAGIHVHGIHGFDAAHKTAAQTVKSLHPDATHFFTVDGDNQLLPGQWQKLIEADWSKVPLDCVHSWKAINIVNGLCYGNGGLKLWPIEWVVNMRTHEASHGEVKVDFCWDDKYVQHEAIMSLTIINGSAYQAYRAGFREGAKMSMVQGKTQDRFAIAESVGQVNLNRFKIWASIGRDQPFGYWAILGAFEGFLMANSGGLGDVLINQNEMRSVWTSRDYDKLSLSPQADAHIDALVYSYRDKLKSFNLNIPAIGSLQSKTCKLLAEYTQPENPFTVELWTNKLSLPTSI